MSNLPDYSEVERLRLQLYQTELQRDAFKAMAEARLDVLIREVLQKEKPDYQSLAKGYDEKPIETDFFALLKRVQSLEASAWHEHTRINTNRDNLDHLIRRVEALEAKSNG